MKRGPNPMGWGLSFAMREPISTHSRLYPIRGTLTRL